MNTRQRFRATMAFEPCDRTLLWEWGYWGGAIARWYEEGLPYRQGLREAAEYGDTVAGPGAAWRSGVLDIQRAVDVSEAVALDGGRETIPLQNFVYPHFEEAMLEETAETLTFRNKNGGVTQKRKDAGSVPHEIAWPVSNWEDWEKLKAERFQVQIEKRLPDNWQELVRAYQVRDYPLSIASGTCGYFGSPRTLMGDINLFYAFYDQPELIHDMLDFLTDFWIEIYGKVLADVGEVESAEFWEDMCYKNGPMISPALFREFMMPHYKRLIGFLRDQGVRDFCVDTDGDCTELIPLFLECGMAGMFAL
ncbi:MAG: hypothetical protein GY759_08695 [Chloroflexi bacterium]|nr:hypothetical protein [Chloroflexota bacterium]